MAIDSETITVETICGHTVELELDVNWCNAEPDVGIMSAYADDFKVTAVNGSTRHAKWADRIISRNEALTNRVFDAIMDGQ